MRKLAFLLVSIIILSCNTETPPPKVIEDINDELITKDSLVVEKSSEPKEAMKELVLENTFGAYVNDPGSEPTNVRITPGGEIMLQLSKDCGHEVVINGVADGWFLVQSVWGIDNENETHDQVNGYIHGSILAVDTRNYGQEEVYLYAEADEQSPIVIKINEQIQLSLMDVSEDANWIYVQWNNHGSPVEGWIQRNWICGSLVTNCS